jgi:hypothetical protein
VSRIKKNSAKDRGFSVSLPKLIHRHSNKFFFKEQEIAVGLVEIDLNCNSRIDRPDIAVFVRCGTANHQKIGFLSKVFSRSSIARYNTPLQYI